MEDKLIEQKESIKLTKNAKGDYQWEVKILAEEAGVIDPKITIERLEKINKELEEKFGKQ